MTDNMTWEPIGDGVVASWTEPDLDSPYAEHEELFLKDDGSTLCVGPGPHDYSQFVLQPDVRLCRAKPISSPKIDWSKAPPWATHHAFCGDGLGVWLKTDGTPEVDGWGWRQNATPGTSRWIKSGFYLKIGNDWRTTLTCRPEVTP